MHIIREKKNVIIFSLVLLLLFSMSSCDEIINIPSDIHRETEYETHEDNIRDEIETESSNIQTEQPDIEDVKNSVVMIEAYGENFSSSGSGFCVFFNNWIVTNNHVIEDAHKIVIISDDYEKINVNKVIFSDPKKDIAILEVDSVFTPLSLGSGKSLEIKDRVTAIGSPQGVLNTVSEGIISNVDFSDEIRITAPISPGSSGGVLLNDNYEVIGITCAGYNNAQNLNFAINVEVLKDAYDAYLKGEYDSTDIPINTDNSPYYITNVLVEYDPDLQYFYFVFSLLNKWGDYVKPDVKIHINIQDIYSNISYDHVCSVTESNYEEYYIDGKHIISALIPIALSSMNEVSSQNGTLEYVISYEDYYFDGALEIEDGIPAHIHDYVITDTSDPTCVTSGYEKRICKTCGFEYQVNIDALKHNYILIEKTEPTCTSNGNSKYSCSRCGNIYDREHISSGHKYITAEVAESTCKAQGYIKYMCESCGSIYMDHLQAVDHKYELASISAATCTSDGYKLYKCKACEHTYTKIISMLDHKYEIIDCGLPYKCTDCGLDSEKIAEHTNDQAFCSHCGECLFEKQTYTGKGPGFITDIDLPYGYYNIIITHNGDGLFSACLCDQSLIYQYGKVSYLHQIIPNDADKYSSDISSPLKDGYINITDSDGNWSITIEAINYNEDPGEDFETLIFSGRGPGYIPNIDLPTGYYNIIVTHTGNDIFDVRLCDESIIYRYGNVSYIHQIIPNNSDKYSNTVMSPIRKGYINILNADGEWTITIQKVGG